MFFLPHVQLLHKSCLEEEVLWLKSLASLPTHVTDWENGAWLEKASCPHGQGTLRVNPESGESDLTSLSLGLLSVKCGKGYNPGPAEVCRLNAIS